MTKSIDYNTEASEIDQVLFEHGCLGLDHVSVHGQGYGWDQGGQLQTRNHRDSALQSGGGQTETIAEQAQAGP